MWCPTLLRSGLRFVQGRRTRNWVKERDPICTWTNGIAQRMWSRSRDPQEAFREIDEEINRVSFLVGKAQLAGCLKIYK